jgi:hypothetical protein
MSKPSNEVNRRWRAKAYKQINLCLRYDTDQPLIDWLQSQANQGIGATEAIRQALNAYLKTAE